MSAASAPSRPPRTRSWGAFALTALLLPLAPVSPNSLQVDGVANNPSVTDNTPDFTAVHNDDAVNPANRRPATEFQIQVSTNSGFSAITWNGPPGNAAMGAGTNLPAPNPLASGNGSGAIRYGLGGQQGGGAVPPLSWGQQYFWHIRFRNNNNVWSPFSSESASFTMAAPSALASANGNGSPVADSWRMIGVPIQRGTTVPAGELLDDGATLYRWNEPTRLWIQMGSGDVLRGGEGYLLWTPANASVDLSTGTVASGSQVFFLPWTDLPGPQGQEIVEGKGRNALAGNHFISNPFNTSIHWGTSFPIRINMSDIMYVWDGTQYRTYQASSGAGTASPQIRPFQAVGIVVNDPVGGQLLTDPTTSFSAEPPLSGPTPNSWALSLVIQSGSATDTETYIGVHPDADDAWDRRDGEEPGAGAASWILAWFDHWNWTSKARDYTHDFRKTRLIAGEEIVWNLTVTGNTGQLATLTWPAVGQMPTAEWQYRIEDPATGFSYDMAATPSMQVGPISGGTPYPLGVRARRTNTFQGRLEVLPAAGGPAPAGVTAGQSDVAMLDVEVWAHDENVTVNKLVVRHEGTGDPAQVSVSLWKGGARIAGPVPFAAGSAGVFTGLNRLVQDNVGETWRVVYDFAAGATGTYRAAVFAEEVEGVGALSTRTISPAPGPVRSTEATVSAPPAGSGGGGGGGGCGLSGAELVLVLLGAWLIRAGGKRRGA